MANQQALQDDNQVFALIAHTGTADTAETVRLVANSSGQLSTTASVSAPGTQTVAGADASGGSATNPPVMVGGTDSGGTVYGFRVDTDGILQSSASLALNTGTLTTGSLANIGQVHNAGTIQTGSIANIAYIHEIGTMPAISIGESTGGTLDIITRVGNVGTLELGSVVVNSVTTGSLANIATLHNGTVVVSALPTLNIASGTQQTLGTVSVVNNLATGTLAAVTSVSSLAAGTVNLVTRVGNVGTLELGSTVVNSVTTGSLANLATLHNGTVVVSTLPTLNIASGTQQTLGTVGVVNNIVTGTINRVNSGTLALVSTVSSVTNLAAGTITRVNGGTVAISNLAAGTTQINHVPVNTVTSTHVLGTGGTIAGTLLAPAGAGTSVYLAGLSIVCHSGTADFAIANNVAGSTGNGVYARGFFAPGGGIMREFNTPINLGTNGTITYFVTGNGTASFTVNYWKSS